jgi:biotin carboxyl carrier protein
MAALCGFQAAVLLALASPAAGNAGSPGGTTAPAGPQAGGTEFGVSASVSEAPRPVVGQLIVPRSLRAGRPPRVTLRLDERGVSTVAGEVTVSNLSTHRTVLAVSLGWVRTGRPLTVAWPRGAVLSAGVYRLSVSGHDHHSGTLRRTAHSSGVATLTVLAPPPAPPPPPQPPPVPAPPPAATEEGVPTPAQTAAWGSIFPVAGVHDFGGPENRFGAARSNHTHQGQDVLTSEGTAIVAPLAGTIVTASYQAAGAGYYAVEHTPQLDFMFAHCQAGSLAVQDGQAVSAGQVLCQAGQTGDATTPHLHFEIWAGGWRVSPASHPIDPLPYLEAWEHAHG